MAKKNETTKSEQKLEQKITLSELTTQVSKSYNFITPKHLSELTSLDQPTVRRHLRKHFSEVMTHTLGEKWSFETSKDSTKDIIKYFYSMCVIDATKLIAK
jgi:DNA-binding transcriptional ArsR family regulator